MGTVPFPETLEGRAGSEGGALLSNTGAEGTSAAAAAVVAAAVSVLQSRGAVCPSDVTTSTPALLTSPSQPLASPSPAATVTGKVTAVEWAEWVVLSGTSGCTFSPGVSTVCHTRRQPGGVRKSQSLPVDSTPSSSAAGSTGATAAAGVVDERISLKTAEE